MVRGAAAFGSTPASWAEAPVEDATMSANIEKIKCRSRTAYLRTQEHAKSCELAGKVLCKVQLET